MEGSLEERLRSIEARLGALEQLLAGGPRPAKPKDFWGFETEVPPAAAKPPAAPRAQPRSIEDLLGGRVLAWLGGVAVVLGFVFFLGMAVSRGWIGQKDGLKIEHGRSGRGDFGDVANDRLVFDDDWL